MSARLSASVNAVTRAIFYTATTLDGFLADDSDSLDWLFVIPQDDDGFPAFLEGVGAIVRARRPTSGWSVMKTSSSTPRSGLSSMAPARTGSSSSRSLARIPGADVRFASGAVRDSWEEIAASAGDKDVWIVGGGDLAETRFADARTPRRDPTVGRAGGDLGLGAPAAAAPLRVADRLTLTSVALRTVQFAELTYAVRRTDAT